MKPSCHPTLASRCCWDSSSCTFLPSNQTCVQIELTLNIFLGTSSILTLLIRILTRQRHRNNNPLDPVVAPSTSVDPLRLPNSHPCGIIRLVTNSIEKRKEFSTMMKRRNGILDHHSRYLSNLIPFRLSLASYFIPSPMESLSAPPVSLPPHHHHPPRHST